MGDALAGRFGLRFLDGGCDSGASIAFRFPLPLGSSEAANMIAAPSSLPRAVSFPFRQEGIA